MQSQQAMLSNKNMNILFILPNNSHGNDYNNILPLSVLYGAGHQNTASCS